ncbi:putative YhdH/YhfP family quinone oxidoreductase [Aureibacillus halotolerans]|uniref:Putative YhdH/YhfP family quinone oxidoreductase n=1 Tax=Aureibacillus halotolerans TaxID=1508390 RepID=A0A4R6U9V7_9BACI|nr:putative YhdH/YhfP family quinone oxidoreductase [Aureibacillus halotolerans]
MAYSSVNYKDGLASTEEGGVVRSYPMVPGIDMAGIVISSSDPRFIEGDEVIATSYGLGVQHFGGYSEYAQLPADWVVPLPETLSLKDAMIFGTAGFTAALSVERLEENGLSREQGPVLVTGATGGVGSMAVAMLAKRGYEVVASTGKTEAHDFLKGLGAKDSISREDVQGEKATPLQSQTWAGAVDPVGGTTLANVLSRLSYQGAVAVSGLTGGVKVPATVMPFILRGVSLLGIDSVQCPMPKRQLTWNRMATDLNVSEHFTRLATTIRFDELPTALEDILKGKAQGRWVVEI